MRKVVLITLVSLFGVFSISAQDKVSDEKTGVKVKPTVALHGRIQYDFEFLNRKGLTEADDYSLKGQEFRRVYLSASGTIYKNIKYKAQFEFAGARLGYRDLYIRFADLPYIGGDLSLGSMGEATGLDMVTSSKYIPFFERAMLTNTQNFRWNSGLHYHNFDIANGALGLQMSYCYNGKQNEGFLDEHLEKGGHFVARLTSPIIINSEKHQKIHLGVNYENRKRTEDPEDYTLNFRPENHLESKVSIPIAGLATQSDIGFELAGMFGPFTIAGEYEVAGYHTDNGTDTEIFNINGYYADASYFLFGGRRGYKNGAFARVVPYDNFCIKDGGYGAMEIGVRYSTMDYSSIITTGSLDKISNVTFGLNWYLNSHTRIVYNYIITDLNDVVNTNKMHANLIRVQVDY